MASVVKVRRVYKGEVTEKWAVKYRNAEGCRKTAQPPSGLKKDADKLRQKIEREIEAGTHIAASDALTVAQVCEHYLRHVEDKLRDKRIGRNWHECTKATIDRQIVPRLGGRLMIDLTGPLIEQWFSNLRREEDLKVSTVKQKLYIFKQIEEFAFKRRLLKTRPVTDAAGELRGIKDEVIRTFTADEVGRLLSAAKVRPKRVLPYNAALGECFVNVASFCGLRWGEIKALTAAAVDLDGRTIRVRHNLTKFDEVKAPKTAAGVRDVPMPAHVVAMLRAWIGTHAVPNDRGLLFRNSDGGMLSAGNFHNNVWGPMLKRAGLLDDGERYHFHALRHFCASWMIENGISIMDVARLLGHSKFDMTLQVYAHPVVSGTRHHAVVDRMASLLIAAPLTIDVTKRPPQRLSL